MRRAPLAWVLLLSACLGGGSGQSGRPPDPPVRQPSASPRWWNGAVFYEVFVRSFRDSDGDGAGDLAGLVAGLDYLNDGQPAATTTSLGVDAIWLMPIYPSPSYHGYDVTDYQGVSPAYGKLAAFDTLVTEAHRRGIKIILDFVPNHSSDQHPWFVDAASSPASAHRDWYVWSATDPGWRQPWACGSGSPSWISRNGAFYYGVFWSGMPDLNWRSPAVRAELAASAAFWLGRGADGFRLDAVRYLVENGACAGQQDQPETHAYLRALSASVWATRPDAALVGEAWADTGTIARYFGSTATVAGGDELPLLFDFPLADGILTAVKGGTAAPLASALDAVAASYPAGAGDAPFLTNHDQVRLATQLGNDPAQLRLAAAILLTLQGSPFVYYGEEVGMQNGGCGGDECKRAPMAWDATAAGGFTTGTPWWPLPPGAASANVATQAGDPGSLLSRYRSLIRARRLSPALARGGTRRLPAADAGVLALLRELPGETVLVVHNLGGAPAMVGPWAVPGTVAETLFADPAATISGAGSWTVTLPGRGSAVWRLR